MSENTGVIEALAKLVEKALMANISSATTVSALTSSIERMITRLDEVVDKDTFRDEVKEIRAELAKNLDQLKIEITNLNNDINREIKAIKDSNISNQDLVRDLMLERIRADKDINVELTKQQGATTIAKQEMKGKVILQVLAILGGVVTTVLTFWKLVISPGD